MVYEPVEPGNWREGFRIPKSERKLWDSFDQRMEAWKKEKQEQLLLASLPRCPECGEVLEDENRIYCSRRCFLRHKAREAAHEQ